MNPAPDDEALLRRLQAGDEMAWDTTFRLLYPVAFNAARHPLAGLTPHEAEDIAIESITQMLSKVGQVSQIRELKALVATIASRRAISERRKQNAEKRGGGEVNSVEAMQDESEGRYEPEDLSIPSLKPMELLELADLLEDAMTELEPEHVKLLRQFVTKEKSYKELSSENNLPMGSIGVILSRSLSKIRTKLKSMPTLAKELRAFLR
jgi:RNA polymerase sigma factor (sigma-70 family)